MTQMVTRCPKCATAFRITSTQLESAKGSVRCGSCLHIFKAREHLLNITSKTTAIENTSPINNSLSSSASPETNSPAQSNAIQPAITKPFLDKSKILADEDDELISDDMDQRTSQASTYDFDGFLDVDLHPKQTTSLFDRDIRNEAKKDSDINTVDESWAEELLDDTEENHRQLNVQTSLSSTAESTGNEAARESSMTADMHTAINTHQQHNTPIFSFVNEPDTEQESEFSEAFINATRSNDDSQNNKATAIEFAENLFDEPSEPEQAQSNKPSVKKTHKIRGLENSRASLLMNIMPAPVELTARRMRRWYQEKIWSAVALLALTLLLAQISYFKFDYFSRVEPYRTGFVFACPLIGCKVPNLIDKSHLQANSLQVHSHSSIKNALSVDTNLLNTADFEQPFPDLLLTFTTIDDQPVAARRFTPKEYLAGELIGKTHIPSRQPVHITLEIADPGAEAVNYSLTIP